MGLFGNVGGQGDKFDSPISPSGRYYGFLSKADPAGGTYGVDDKPLDSAYDVLFEVIPKEWFDNVIMSPKDDVRQTAPSPPASLYHLWNVPTDKILGTLGLRSTDDLAEGSWYLLTLEKGTGDVTGDLYDPDIDLGPGSGTGQAT